MCGITGIYSFDNEVVSLEVLESMTRSLVHRGPNDFGEVLINREWKGDNNGRSIKSGLQKEDIGIPIEYKNTKSKYTMQYTQSNHNICFGHTRLSVIDLSPKGHQPMCNSDRSIWITYNGEIYNYRELQNNLKSDGYNFKSNSDTEVIIAAYQKWGISCIERFNGMFAFALWDGKRELLFLVRDRFGIKPLYYYYSQKEFCFASEIKGILANKNYTSEVDLNSIYNYIGLLYVHGKNTIWKGIKSVPPGCYLKIKGKRVSIQRYWSIKPNYIVSFNRKKEGNFWIDGIVEHLKKAVKYRMVSDVPIGAFLSGGVDSSCITFLMTQLTGQKVKTFSLGFEEDDDHVFNELPYAKRVAQYLGTEHHEFVISYHDILKEISEVIQCFDEPFAGALPQYFLSRLAKKYVTVCLGGLGGDEIFGSYGRFFSFRNLFGNRFILHWLLPENIKKMFNRKTIGYYYFNRFGIFSEEEKEKLLNKDVFREQDLKISIVKEFDKLLERPLSNPLDVCCLADMATQLEGEYLKYTDRLSMVFALEMRVPFLDHEFVEFVFSIPPHCRVSENNLKYLLFLAFGSELPKEVFGRKKGGFSLPYNSWINKELKSYILEYLSPNVIRNRGLLNPKFIAQILKQHYSGEKDHTYKIWSLFILELWYRLYIDHENILF